jgi:hypothetical protein
VQGSASLELHLKRVVHQLFGASTKRESSPIITLDTSETRSGYGGDCCVWWRGKGWGRATWWQIAKMLSTTCRYSMSAVLSFG